MTTTLPQADRPETIAAAVDAVAAGHDTAGQVAAEIGLSPRQGAYYLAAAARLGLVARDGHQVTLTADGQRLADAQGRVRLAWLTAALAADPLVDAVGPKGGVAKVKAAGVRSGASPSTVTRRVRTVSSWNRFVQASLSGELVSV